MLRRGSSERLRFSHFDQQRGASPPARNASSAVSPNVVEPHTNITNGTLDRGVYGTPSPEHTRPSGVAGRPPTPQDFRRLGLASREPHDQPLQQHESPPSRLSREEAQTLTEVAAPAPIQQEEEKGEWPHDQPLQQHQSPSSRLSREEAQDLTEIAAPAPIQQENEKGEWRKEQHLEDAETQAEALPEREPLLASRVLTQLYIVSHLIFWAILADLSRLGVQWLTFYPGAPVVIGNIWANFGGTLFMGFLQEDQRLFREEWGKRLSGDDSESMPNGDAGGVKDKPSKKGRGKRLGPDRHAAHSKVKKTIPLFIGLTTGYCGTFTSFSTFIRDTFYALANILPTPLDHPPSVTAQGALTTSTVPRPKGYSFNATAAIIILTLCVCNAALYIGAHFAIALDRVMPTLSYRLLRRFLDPLILLLGPGCWIAAIVMCVFPPDRPGGPAAHANNTPSTWRGDALFSLCFAPAGCLLRFFLSLKLNGVVHSFPLGTFTVNVFGTAVLCMCLNLQHLVLPTSMAPGGGFVGCQLLQGVTDGFCGALTTVSTWIVELNTLRRRHAWVYGSTSVVVGMGTAVVVVGSVYWSHAGAGWKGSVCYPGNV